MPERSSHLDRFVRLGLALLSFICLAGMAQAGGYWFEYYERAVELIDDSDTDRAETLLTEVVKSHPLPQSSVRLPGNRYISYLPYLQRARIEFQKGEYELASRSLDVSEAFGAVAGNRRSQTELLELRESLKLKKIRGEFTTDRAVTLRPAAATD